jgi:hypothetical protein
MGFDDFIDNKHGYHENYSRHRYYENDRYSDDSYHKQSKQSDDLKWLNVLDKIRNNKKLKLIIVMAGLVIITIVVILIIALYPLILKLINYISQNGLQGVFNDISGFLEKIWKSSGN